MPRSFLFTHRRYNASPIPTESEQLADGSNYSALPASPGTAAEAQLLIKSPGRPQAARISPVIKAVKPIPEEMYNLFQLAEVSLASSSNQPLASEFRSVLERWHKQHEDLAMRVLAKPAKIQRRAPADCQQISVDIPVANDKPLDLSRDLSRDPNAQVRVLLTPSPSPTPSETHLTQNLGLQKNFRQDSPASRQMSSPTSATDEEVDDSSDSCSVAAAAKATCKGSESHSGDGHECPECGKRYSTSSNLARHRQTHRSPADQKARRCPHCDKVYVSVPAFSMHVRTHSQGCKCPYCGKSFSRPWLLQGHIRTHTGEKPFSCQICDKAFADKSNLRAHIQTHSNLKPFTCQRCGKAFALKSYLYKHEESSCMKVAKTKIDAL